MCVCFYQATNTTKIKKINTKSSNLVTIIETYICTMLQLLIFFLFFLSHSLSHSNSICFSFTSSFTATEQCSLNSNKCDILSHFKRYYAHTNENQTIKWIFSLLRIIFCFFFHSPCARALNDEKKIVLWLIWNCFFFSSKQWPGVWICKCNFHCIGNFNSEKHWPIITNSEKPFQSHNISLFELQWWNETIQVIFKHLKMIQFNRQFHFVFYKTWIYQSMTSWTSLSVQEINQFTNVVCVNITTENTKISFVVAKHFDLDDNKRKKGQR